MYYVFLDTNLFVSNFQFNKHWNSKLLKYARRGDVKICITYTNYLEIIKKFKDFVTPFVNQINTSNADFNKLVGYAIVQDPKRSSYYTEEYKVFLDNLLQENNISIIKHSSDFSEKIINKFFGNNKPFDIGKPSFQDAIIWETLLDYYQYEVDIYEDKIFFLTRNIKDFGKEIKEADKIIGYKLHQNLFEEAPKLQLYKDTEEFFKFEEENLHDYLMDTFELDEEKTMSIIQEYLKGSKEIQFEIDHFLSMVEFTGEYFTGWGENSYSEFKEIVISRYSKDVENGDIELFFYVNYDVDFTISTINPVYEHSDIDSSEYLRDEGGYLSLLLTVSVIINENEISNFSIEETQIV